MSDALPGIIISNPGSNQEVREMAAALTNTGRLRRYHVPIAVSEQRLASLDRLPGPVGKALQREARRRPFPAGLAPDRIRRTAAMSAIARVAGARIGLPPRLQFRIGEGYLAHLDKRVASHLGPECDTVVAVQGAALKTLRRAQDIGARAVLNATVPEPRFLARTIEEEMTRRPAEARQLLGDQPPDAWLARRVSELAHADRILVPSSFARDTYANAGVDPDRLIVTPLGVDIDLFTPEPEPAERQGFRVLFVGRISQAKGAGYLVEAFRRAAIPGGELLMVGDAAGARAEWLGSGGVRHRSPVPRADLPEIFRSADVFVMPSLADSFGLVAFEAMACGVPVILSENSAGRDAVDDGDEGYVVPIRDADAIAKRLDTLSRDRDLRVRLGEAARARAEAFSWQRYRERIVEVLNPGG